MGVQRFIKAAGGCSAPAGKSLAERLAGMGQMKWRVDPPYYVRNVRVMHGDELVFSADVDFSISENPAFRFTLRPGTGGALRASVTDSKERVFESSAP